ncbi:cell division protein FtsB [Microcella alkaliphila]|uniref:Cell division protein FtsB n=1 Tax=Microcella alkaliphila TaxID=279828 RepID=A0A4Q7TQE1_9MICO|nr:septum formation initiator family protein [Microcella alkaliphila]RZT62300.1 cell division protein FtsB [Microcella alkaliphila]
MARRTPSIPVVLPDDAPAQTPWFRNLHVSGLTVTVLILIIGALVVLAPSLRVLVEQRQELAALEQRVAEQQALVDGLATEIDRWQDPAFIEAQARDRLLYVYPGDISYLVIDDGQTIEIDPLQPISDEIQTTRVDWSRAVLLSVMTAALTDREADDLVAPIVQGTP